jgi:hypothetical protein
MRCSAATWGKIAPMKGRYIKSEDMFLSLRLVCSAIPVFIIVMMVIRNEQFAKELCGFVVCGALGIVA